MASISYITMLLFFLENCHLYKSLKLALFPKTFGIDWSSCFIFHMVSRIPMVYDQGFNFEFLLHILST